MGPSGAGDQVNGMLNERDVLPDSTCTNGNVYRLQHLQQFAATLQHLLQTQIWDFHPNESILIDYRELFL